MILHDETVAQLGYTPEECPVSKKVVCRCDYCGGVSVRTKDTVLRGRQFVQKDACSSRDCMQAKRQEAFLSKYGVASYPETEEFKKKSAATCIERYGTKTYSQTDECKKITQDTCRARYGTDHYLASEQSKAARKEGCLKRYGVEHHAQLPEFKDKIKATTQARYGADFYPATDECKKKVKQTCKERYGTEAYTQTDEYRNKTKQTNQERYGDHPSRRPEHKEMVRNTCVSKYGAEAYSQTDECKDRIRQTNLSRYGVPNTYQLAEARHRKSEAEIRAVFESCGLIAHTNRTVLGGKEIDVYNDEKKIGVEFCGLYWHNELSPTPHGRKYHYDKWKACEAAGVRLFTIFEDEWRDRRSVCEAVLRAKIGSFGRRLFARKCSVREVDMSEAHAFLDRHHIQGAAHHSLMALGLETADGEMAGVLTLGRHHRQTGATDAVVLDRLCFTPATQVVGGASRLIAHARNLAQKRNYKQILSWSDNRWSTGRVYEATGFKLDGHLPPDYSYVVVKSGNRVSKQSQKKSNTGCPKEVTERDWAIQHGMARIWDCGKKRWVMDV